MNGNCQPARTAAAAAAGFSLKDFLLLCGNLQVRVQNRIVQQPPSWPRPCQRNAAGLIDDGSRSQIYNDNLDSGHRLLK